MVRKRKSKHVRFWTRCLEKILDETLDMKAKAAQFETALYFLLLSSLPSNRPTSQVLKRMP